MNPYATHRRRRVVDGRVVSSSVGANNIRNYPLEDIDYVPPKRKIRGKSGGGGYRVWRSIFCALGIALVLLVCLVTLTENDSKPVNTMRSLAADAAKTTYEKLSDKQQKQAQTHRDDDDDDDPYKNKRKNKGLDNEEEKDITYGNNIFQKHQEEEEEERRRQQRRRQEEQEEEERRQQQKRLREAEEEEERRRRAKEEEERERAAATIAAKEEEERIQRRTTTMDNDVSSLLPTLKYGTAWKKERTAELVREAIHAGFRHIDTACQPKHYNEKGVGEGWTQAARELGLSRSDIWIQTKFSNQAGQDPDSVPYDVNAPIEDQVRQSLAASLKNLQTDYLDSMIMHSPETQWDMTFRVWAVLESFIENGTVKKIGVSNAWDSDFVKYLYSKVKIKPHVVQQRFHGESKYEVETRRYCKLKDIEFQSFWTLGANRHIFENNRVKDLAASKHLSPQVLLYAFCITVGITVLDGTTSTDHMREDIDLLRRMKEGDKIFDNHGELTIVAEALGIPGWE